MPSSLLSSQGQDFGISNAYKISIKTSRSAKVSKNDVSTLSIAHGGDRVYEDGLEDPGPNSTDGVIVTATVNTYGAAPEKGTIMAFKGRDCKCMTSETTNDAGKPVEGVATFSSDYPSDCE